MKLIDLKEKMSDHIIIFNNHIVYTLSQLISMIEHNANNGYEVAGCYEIILVNKNDIEGILETIKNQINSPIVHFIDNSVDVIEDIENYILMLENQANPVEYHSFVDFIDTQIEHERFDIVTNVIDEDNGKIEMDYLDIEIEEI